jgi:transcriptional regulator with XRE-family HTH domain
MPNAKDTSRPAVTQKTILEDEHTVKSFGESVRAARKARGKTLRDLSSEIDLHFSYLSRIENGTLPHAPSEDVVRRIARALDLNADEAMLKAGWLPEWFEKYLIENPSVTSRLMDAFKESPQAPLEEV